MAQQLQNVTISAPAFSGINTQDSPIDLDPSFAKVADNCVIDSLGRIGARNGYELLTTDATDLGASVGTESIFEYIDQSGDITVLSAGNNKLFSGTTTLTEITPAGYSPTANNWKFANLNNHCYLFQKGHESLIFTDASGSATLTKFSSFGSASGTAPQANEVISAFGRLWAADVTGNQHTVFFSHLQIGYQWTGGSSGSLAITSVLPAGEDPIVALAAHNGKLIIFCRNTILIYAGATTPSSMTLEDTIVGVGCIARDSVVSIGTDLLFLSDSGLRSLGRTIQEKSAAIGDLSQNVRNDLIGDIATETGNIKTVYSPENSFYLLALPSNEKVYVFDISKVLPTGAFRVTTWSSINPLCFVRERDGDLIFGRAGGIAKYSTFKDNDAAFTLQYFSNPLAFQQPANVKFLKKFNLTIIGGAATSVVFKWGYDYSEAYETQNFTIGSSAAAEYGVSEYGGTAEYTASLLVNTPKINATGGGEVVTVGLEANIAGAPFSIQRIDILVLLGRIL